MYRKQFLIEMTDLGLKEIICQLYFTITMFAYKADFQEKRQTLDLNNYIYWILSSKCSVKVSNPPIRCNKIEITLSLGKPTASIKFHLHFNFVTIETD